MTRTFDAVAVGRIEATTGAGDDSITIGDDIIGTYINGGDGSDTIRGGSGNDTLSGGGGRNYIYGNAGDDRLNGAKRARLARRRNRERSPLWKRFQ